MDNMQANRTKKVNNLRKYKENGSIRGRKRHLREKYEIYRKNKKHYSKKRNCKAISLFYCLGKYKISISYKSKVLLHFHIKKYKIKDSNFIISLPLVRVGWIFVLM